jgi:hypothetical protein
MDVALDAIEPLGVRTADLGPRGGTIMTRAAIFAHERLMGNDRRSVGIQTVSFAQILPQTLKSVFCK